VEVIRFWEEEGVTVPEPYNRHIKIVLASDKRNVEEITFSHVVIYPHSKTDYHSHDRPELIIITAGRGKSVCDGQEIQVEPDMALWVKAGEKHQMINECDEMLKLLTVFTPAYKAKDLLGGILAAARKDS
jgi:mannose-6-phosphate isomerase-like protein (cupin superfamily)